MDHDPFVQDQDSSDVEFAVDLLTKWLPFLTRDLCDRCSQTLTNRIQSLHPHSTMEPPNSNDPSCCGADPNSPDPGVSPVQVSTYNWSEHVEPTGWDTDPDQEPDPNSPKVRMSWADMAQEEDELAEEEENAREREEVLQEGGGKKKTTNKVELSREQREWIRFSSVGRKKDFICLERVKGKIVNIMEGLELHTGVFSAVEQKRIVDFVYELQEKGRKSELGERTYSEPQKWMRGKGRVTIQFGCCYNYAMDKDGNPPGILRNVKPDSIPNLFKVIIRRLIRWHVLPTSCVPDSCIVNIYEPGDCIPPHIDSHDFVRPFSTVSFLSECNILFGTNLKVEGEGEFSGAMAIPLPVGSVLVLNGNGADVAKHCVPAVPTKRISITFRKMDETKQPIGFSPEPDLQNIQPLPSQKENNRDKQQRRKSRSSKRGNKYRGRPAGVHHHQPYDLETTPTVRPRQVIDARTLANNHNSVGKNMDSSERPYHFRPKPSSQDARRLRDAGEYD